MGETAASELVQRLLESCETEGREHSLVPREYRLIRGERVAGAPGRFIYRFESLSKIPVKQDSAAEIKVGDAVLPVSLLKRSGHSVELATSVDLGGSIDDATLVLEHSSLLGILSSRLRQLAEQPPEHFNSRLAEIVFSVDHLRSTPIFAALPPTEGLTDEQRQASSCLSALEAGFLWGPPGTGKTATLAALAHAAFSANRRTLLVSQTNDAVDGLLEALCRRVSGRAKLAIPEGSVLRLGPISRPELAESFGSQVELESVLARAQEKTAKRLEGFRADHRRIRDRISQLESALALYRSETALSAKLLHLQAQRRLAHPGLFATLRRVFFGWGKTKEVVVDETVDLDAEISLIEAGLKKVTVALEGVERGRLSADLADAKAEEPEIAGAVSRLEEVLREVRRGSIDRARVVATTAARAMLAPEQLSGFDLVIIDEASMLPLPLVYLLSGLSKSQVVLAGDFRQLPPIAVSSAPIVREWYARDIFETSGIVDLVERGEPHACLFQLTTQFRCREEIASVFNTAFYRGSLHSSYKPNLSLEHSGRLAALSGRPVVILDTSSLSPAGQSAAKSKANLLHAILIRDVRAALTSESGFCSDHDLGVVSPYRPQVALLRELINEDGGQGVAVGTAHRFQGDERPVIILDLTESAPHRLGAFLGASSLREAGAKLLNVALSRAKEQLIIVADLRHLAESLSTSHLLHGIIAQLKQTGAVVDAALLLEPPSEPGREGGAIGRAQNHSRALFLSAFIDNLRNAGESCVLVSPAVSLPLVKVIANTLATREVPLALKVFVPPFGRGVAESLDEYESSLDLLSHAGAEILYCAPGGQSLVLLDRQVAWIGTLSPLSCRESDVGTMTRVGGRAAAEAARRFLLPVAMQPVEHPATIAS